MDIGNKHKLETGCQPVSGSIPQHRVVLGSRDDKELTLRERVLFSTVSLLSREGSVVVRNVDSNSRHFTIQDYRLPFNTIAYRSTLPFKTIGLPQFSIRPTDRIYIRIEDGGGWKILGKAVPNGIAVEPRRKCRGTEERESEKGKFKSISNWLEVHEV